MTFPPIVAPLADSGWKTYDDAKGREFLPAATNYCTNPSLELDTAGLCTGLINGGNTAAPPTFTKVAALAGSLGSYAQRVQYTSAGDTAKQVRVDSSASPASSVTAGQVWKISCLVKPNLIGTGAPLYLAISWRNNADGGIATSTQVQIAQSSSVSCVSVIATAPAGAERLRFSIFTNSFVDTGESVDFTIDDLFIGRAGAYFDGSYPQCGWTGLANASTSTKIASVCSFPAKSGLADEGTIAMLITPEWAGGDGLWHTILCAGSGNQNFNNLKISKGTPPDVWAVSYADGSALTQMSGDVSDGIGPANVSHAIIVRWVAGETLDICVDGIHRPQVPLPRSSAAWTSIALNPTPLTSPATAFLGPIIVSNERKPLGWVDALSDALFEFSDSARLSNEFCNEHDVLIPFDGSANGYGRLTGVDYKDVLVIADGDSMSTQLGNAWPPQMDLPTTWDIHSFAYGGENIDQILAGEADALAWAATQPHPHKVLVFQDVGSTQADMATKWVTYASTARAAGLKVIACTGSSSGNELVEPQSVATEWLRANYQTFADGLADIAANPTIGAVGAYTNSTYFADATHMNAAGNVISAGIIKATVERVLAPVASIGDIIALLGTPMQAGDYTAPDNASAASADAKLDDVLLKTDTIGALAVTVTSPVAASGTITVYSGDDYASADSRAITVTVADTGHAMGLDGAVVKLKATQATWEAASVASTTDGYTVTFEATAAQTAAITRAQRYELEATLANGHVVTLAKGSLVTVKDIPAVGAP